MPGGLCDEVLVKAEIVIPVISFTQGDSDIMSFHYTYFRTK